MAKTRSALVRQNVLASTVEALVEGGVERLTIDAVAARSGVAKTTIYRHWPSKAALVIDGVASAMHPLPTPDTGDPRIDLASWCEAVGAESDDDPLSSLFLSVLEAARRDPELSRLAEQLRDARQKPLHLVLELARLRGQISVAVDTPMVVELLAASVIYRRLVVRRAVTHEDALRIVDTVVPELRPALSQLTAR